MTEEKVRHSFDNQALLRFRYRTASQFCTLNSSLHESIAAEISVEEEILTKITLTQLYNEFAAWKPWAADMFGLYMCGRSISCSRELAEKNDVSDRAVRKNKKQFE